MVEHCKCSYGKLASHFGAEKVLSFFASFKYNTTYRQRRIAFLSIVFCSLSEDFLVLLLFLLHNTTLVVTSFGVVEHLGLTALSKIK